MDRDTRDDQVAASHWSASVRLATAFSIVAGLFAVLLDGRLPETTIIVAIIVVGTMVSWLQIDHQPTAATVRHPRRHH